MGVLNIKIRGGRHPKLVMLDGELVMIKKTFTVGTSQAIILPKEWLLAISAIHHKNPTEFAITRNASVLTIRPYFGSEVK